jgi:selenocysteine lyase/cysteine desulfurase
MTRMRCHIYHYLRQPLQRAISTTITTHPSDFDHHALRVARLNHGSFGACPKPVLAVQKKYRDLWLEQPDAMYFSGELHAGIRAAAIAAGTCLVPPKAPPLQPEHLCLTENATVAACAVAKKWGEQIQPGDVVLHLDVAYKAMVHVLEEYCVSRGAELKVIKLPFLAATREELLHAVTSQLEEMPNTTRSKIKYAFLDHVSSQPAILLPLKEMIESVRAHASPDVQICVDGAHSLGSVPNLNVSDLNCDYFFSNLHKWAFAPSTSTIMWSPKLENLQHPIVSW